MATSEAHVRDSDAAFVEDLEKTFQLSDLTAALVSVSNISGAITVEAWEQPQVSIRARKSANSAAAFERTHVIFSQEGDHVRAETVVDKSANAGGLFGFLRREWRTATVEYSVWVPAACAVDVRTVNGPVAVSGLERASGAHVVNGAVLLKRLGGKIEAGTTNGRISAEEISGTADLSAVNGSIDVQAAYLKTLEAHTVSGSLKGELVLDPHGRYAFESTNGSCHLRLPADSRCTIKMQGINGRAESTMPNAQVDSHKGPGRVRWEATVNGGGALVTFKTINGSLTVEPSSATAKTESSPERNTISESGGESRTMQILRAVERGELTVDDALNQI